MVSCILQGGLANTAFTSMACYAYARKHNMRYAIPTRTANSRWKHYMFGKMNYQDADMRNFFHYKSPDIFYDDRPYDVSYHEIPYHEDILLEGHFQSWKYWLDYIDEIRDLFQWQIQPFKAIEYEDSIAVHVRRGDYLTIPDKFPTVSNEYIHNGISHFIQQGFKNFWFFSDDKPYIFDMVQKFNLPSNIIPGFSGSNSDMVDLAIMSSCAGIVMANSSYSLLAYYLNRNPDKQCTAPSVWTGSGFGPVLWNDVYPPGAVIL